MPLVSPPLPGEGRWLPAGTSMGGRAAIYVTQLRPAAGSPAVGVAWIDSAETRLMLYAGGSEPYGTWPEQAAVAPAGQAALLAAFNSGFKVYSYQTGWYDQGRTAEPLQAGRASLVIFSDGRATVGEWGRDVSLGPTVEAVRQNLTLLVDHGVPAPSIDAISQWGATLYGVPDTWRSGIGVTASGNLVYVGGPGLYPSYLARVLIAAGAVRAMELDINPEWVSFSLYSHAGTAIAGETNLLPGMHFYPSHYLLGDARDFFAVFSR